MTINVDGSGTLILQHILTLMMRGRLSSTPSGAYMLEAVNSGGIYRGSSNGNSSSVDGSSANGSLQVAAVPAVMPAAT